MTCTAGHLEEIDNITEAASGLGMQLSIYKTPTEVLRIPQITQVPDIGSSPKAIDTSNKDNRKYTTSIPGLQDLGTLDFTFIAPPMDETGKDVLSELQKLDESKAYGVVFSNPNGRWKRNLSAYIAVRNAGNSNDDVQTAVISLTVASMSDMIFYKAFQIEYDANGGVGAVPVDNRWYEASELVTVMAGAGLMMGALPFLGWNSAKNGTGTSYAPGATLSLTGNMTLYAKYGTGP